MLSSLLRLGLPNDLFRLGFVVKILTHMLYVPCILHALMIRITFYEANKDLCVMFPDTPVMALLLCSQTPSDPVFSLDTKFYAHVNRQLQLRVLF
jgi:hypothetical protein